MNTTRPLLIAALLALSTALVWAVLGFLMRLDPIVNPMRLHAWGSCFGVLIALVAGVLWYRTSSSWTIPWRVLAGVLTLLFALGCGQTAAFGLNRATAQRAPYTERVVVAGMSRVRRDKTQRYEHKVHIKSWFDSSLVTLQTDPSAYAQITIRERVVVTSQRGVLGGVWLNGWETESGDPMTISGVVSY